VKICPAARDIDGPDDVHRPPTEAAEPITFGERQAPEDDPSLDDTEFWPFRSRPIRAASQWPRGGQAPR